MNQYIDVEFFTISPTIFYEFRGSVPDPMGPLGGNWKEGGLLFSCWQRCAG